MAIEQRATSGRAAYVISQLYYYVATVVGVGLLLGGLIASLLAARNGLAFALPGAVVLIALGFVLGGAVRVLTAAVDAALPRCFPTFDSPIPAFAEPQFEQRECQDRAEGERGILDGVIVLVVAGPLFVWHLREGRRATRPAAGPQEAPPGG
jgi:alpha-beta hydrolase superfamily lysophospholipase